MPIYLTTANGIVNSVPIVVITMIISIAALFIGLFQYVRKENKSDIKEARNQATSEVSRITEVMIKLDHIALDLADIKSEIKGVKNEMNSFRDRLTRVEMTANSAHQRLDDYFDKVGEPLRKIKNKDDE